ncbi:MAG TPA: hypothetical protein VIT89_04205 [Solirubrobacterales bacterium]
MRKALSLVASVAVLVLATGIAQAEAAASLDPSFGMDGKASLPSRVEETWKTVQLADGRIVVPSRDGLVALLPTGQIDSSFGVDGFAPLVLPPGATQATVADLSVDSQGRLVVVGNAALCTPGKDGCTDQRHAVLVERFEPSGNLDPGFGEGGLVTSDFGAPRPAPGQSPSVLARHAAIDPVGRIVISAQWVAGYQPYKGYLVHRYAAFVARLDANGEVDTTFATGGVLSIPASETLGAPLVDAQGGFYIQSFASTGSTLMHLQPNGQADPGFGQNGGRPLPKGTDSPVILDGSGRLLLYGDLQGWKERRLANGILIKRLLPNGSLDRSFGRGGAISFRMPRLYTARIALDEQGRILIGAALKEQSKKGRRPALPPGLALTRLRPGGSPDKSFGRRGVVAIPFQRSVELNIESLSVRNGVALMGAGGCGKGSCGRALARVKLGPG